VFNGLRQATEEVKWLFTSHFVFQVKQLVNFSQQKNQGTMCLMNSFGHWIKTVDFIATDKDIF
jgi:hypothetical protein